MTPNHPVLVLKLATVLKRTVTVPNVLPHATVAQQRMHVTVLQNPPVARRNPLAVALPKIRVSVKPVNVAVPVVNLNFYIYRGCYPEFPDLLFLIIGIHRCY